MKYFVLIAHSPTGWSSMSADEQADAMRQHGDFHRAVGSGMLAGEALADPEAATTLRHKDGQPTLTDGPFAETAEIIGGFYLIDAPDLDTLTDWCRLLPKGYSLEIRPCIDVSVPA